MDAPSKQGWLQSKVKQHCLRFKESDWSTVGCLNSRLFLDLNLKSGQIQAGQLPCLSSWNVTGLHICLDIGQSVRCAVFRWCLKYKYCVLVLNCLRFISMLFLGLYFCKSVCACMYGLHISQDQCSIEDFRKNHNISQLLQG